MKLYSHAHEFNSSFAVLTAANWQKYPNQHSPHVVSVDTVDRQVRDGVLHTTRLLQFSQPPPGVLRWLGMPSISYFLEHSTLCPRTRSFTATTHNLSLRSIFCAEEQLTISANREESRLEITASISYCGPMATAAGLVEQAAVDRFRQNAHVGRMALQSVVNKVLEQSASLGCSAAQQS